MWVVLLWQFNTASSLLALHLHRSDPSMSSAALKPQQLNIIILQPVQQP
jgi:hypothetical protein